MTDPIPCVKCGRSDGWDGPVYRTSTIPGYVSRHGCVPPKTFEWLGYACQTCSYERRAPTKDAPPPPPTQDENPGRDVRDGAWPWNPWWAFWR